MFHGERLLIFAESYIWTNGRIQQSCYRYFLHVSCIFQTAWFIIENPI